MYEIILSIFCGLAIIIMIYDLITGKLTQTEKSKRYIIRVLYVMFIIYLIDIILENLKLLQ